MSWNPERIVDLLLRAGDIALDARRDLRREFKSDRSIVTQADQDIEALLTRELEDEAAGVRIIGEETIAQKGEDYIRAALREEAFVIDPIDGTSPFAHGLPNWGVSIGWMRGGRLVEGAVYLPEYGELVITTPRGVEEGRREGADWRWRVLTMPEPAPASSGLVAITQRLAKEGRVELPNPVMALGAAVVPLVGLLQGRFVAYLGSVHLWDAGGALPAIQRLGYAVHVDVGGELRAVGEDVDERTYFLSSSDATRWFFRGDLLICRPEDVERVRAAFVCGEPRD